MCSDKLTPKDLVSESRTVRALRRPSLSRVLRNRASPTARKGPQLGPQLSDYHGSRLGPRVPEHGDLVITTVGDEDLFAVHTDCRDIISQIDANTLQDVA